MRLGGRPRPQRTPALLMLMGAAPTDLLMFMGPTDLYSLEQTTNLETRTYKETRTW